VALVLPENRRPAPWLILVPVVVLILAWSGFKALLGIGSAPSAILDPVYTSLVVGLAVTALMAQALGRVRWPWRIMGVLVIMVLVFVAGSVVGGASGLYLAGSAVYFAICLGITILGILFMRRRIRVRFGVARCLAWLGLGQVIFSILVLLVMLVVFLVAAQGLGPGPEVVPQFLLLGLILGGILFVVTLPFILLMAFNGLWQQRLFALLGLAPMETPACPQIAANNAATPDGG